MKRYFLFITIIICLFPFWGKSQQLSPNAEISLLTCSPGDEMYSLFGHTAIRIKDTNIDSVFNYGTFDFNTPNFYMKFARGRLKYILSYKSFENFMLEYRYTKRGVIEQVLDLTQKEKQQLFQALIVNYRPENRFYHYDFLFDNCSTRARDIIVQNCDGKIQYNYSYIKPATFWNLLDKYMYKSKWIFLGIHLALGSPCDVSATNFQQSFLPDNLMESFNNAVITGEDGNRKLVKSCRSILPARVICKTTIWYLRPLFLFGLLAVLILILTIININKVKQYFLVDYLLFAITGLVGWLIVFLWFFTDHQATGPNWNLLWANPLYLPFALILLKSKSKTARYFFLFNTILLLLILAFWWAIPQQLAYAVIPVIFMLLIRSFNNLKWKSDGKNK